MSHLRRCFTEKFPVQLVLLLRVKSCETLPNLTYPATTEIVHSLITIVGQQVAQIVGESRTGLYFLQRLQPTFHSAALRDKLHENSVWAPLASRGKKDRWEFGNGLFVYFSHKQCELILEDALVVISVITAEGPDCETRVSLFQFRFKTNHTTLTD